MEATRAAVHVQPTEGNTVWLVGDTYTTKISGRQTGGAFALCEGIVPPGGGPRPTPTTPRTRRSSCWKVS